MKKYDKNFGVIGCPDAFVCTRCGSPNITIINHCDCCADCYNNEFTHVWSQPGLVYTWEEEIVPIKKASKIRQYFCRHICPYSTLHRINPNQIQAQCRKCGKILEDFCGLVLPCQFESL